MKLAMTRKRHQSRRSESAEGSIENLLYFKDCKSKQTTTTIAPVLLRSTRSEPDCPCPRMCCSMCCDCGMPLPSNYNPAARQNPMQPAQQPPPFQPPPSFQPSSLRQPMQPGSDGGMGIMHPKRKKLKPKIDDMMLSPLSRRGLSFTRENIKSLINKDEDIKKILKDLVRVTMKKVDLNTRRSSTPEKQNVPEQQEKQEEIEQEEKKETQKEKERDKEKENDSDEDYLEQE